MGNRMSSLPVVQFCSGAGVLGAKHGAGRAAVVSRAFHAMCAREDKAGDLYARLTDKEQAEVREWFEPETIHINGMTLEYSQAETELELMLDADLEATDDPTEAVTVGHADMVWIDISGDGCAFVGDIKKSRYTASLDSLQLHAYGLAAARAAKVRFYMVGIWVAEEGFWRWGDLMDTDDLGYTAMEARILAAAVNTSGEFNRGGHCHDCYHRQHCSEWLIPVADPETALAPFTDPGALTPEKATEAIHLVKAAKDLIKVAEATLKAYADQIGGIPLDEGFVWRGVSTKGRKHINQRKLEEEFPEAYKACMTTSNGYKAYRRVKEAK